jgi:hypothetical protein
MKTTFQYPALINFFLVVMLLTFASEASPQKKNKDKNLPASDTLVTNPAGKGRALQVEFTKGAAHNHPLMAIWIEDTDGNYIQTLYVAQSIATGKFAHGDKSSGQWTVGEVRRPAALPYWSHKRGVIAADGLYLPTPDHPVPDAYTGATPQQNFVLKTRLDGDTPPVIKIMLEINQPWDWNDYWTNARYMDDYEYKSSAQPAVLYEATIDMNNAGAELEMTLIGHSHYSGQDGKLYTDISTLTTALQIAGKIVVKVE